MDIPKMDNPKMDIPIQKRIFENSTKGEPLGRQGNCFSQKIEIKRLSKYRNRLLRNAKATDQFYISLNMIFWCQLKLFQ